MTTGPTTQPRLATTRSGDTRTATARTATTAARAVTAAGLLAAAVALPVTGSATPSWAAAPPSLVVGYPGGALHLDGVAPGVARTGDVTVTNTGGAAARIALAADEGGPLGGDLRIGAQVCAAGTGCSDPLPVSAGPVELGTLGPGESWHVVLSALLDPSADDATQGLTVPLVVRVLADSAVTSQDSTVPPGGGMPVATIVTLAVGGAILVTAATTAITLHRRRALPR